MAILNPVRFGIGRPLELGCGNDDKQLFDKGREQLLGAGCGMVLSVESRTTSMYYVLG